MKRIYIYMRVSTERQARFGESLTDQQSALQRWAEEHDCIIIREYVDAGKTASKEYRTRPAFLQMMADSKVERPDQIVFTRLDRFTRNQRDYHNLAYDFDRANLEWCTIWENYDSTTQQGRFAISVMMALFENESKNTSARVVAHNIEKRRRGELVSGNLPRGYIIQDKKPAIDPDAREGIAAFWDTILSGGTNAAAIRAAAVHGVHITQPAVYYMRRHAMNYAGTIQGVPAPAYISPEDAQRVMDHSMRSHRPDCNMFLFSGLLLCGDCGRAFGARSRKSAVGISRYYSCASRSRYPGTCSNGVHILERDVESALLDGLEDGLLSLLNQQKSALADPKKLESMRRRINTLQGQNARLLDVYLDGILSKEEFERKRAALDAEIENLNKSLTIAHAQKKPAELRELLPAGWKESYRELDYADQRAFWFRVLKEIRVYPDRHVEFVPQT